MMIQQRFSRSFYEIFFLVALIIGGIQISFNNYLLFHSVFELLSIIVAFSISVIALNTYHMAENNFLAFFGITYGFIGGIDLLHTLAYNDMGVFPGNTANLATQLWIAARYLESISFVVSAFLFYKVVKLRNIFYIYFIVVVFLLMSIFVWDIFPVSFLVGTGLTLFKKVSELIISLLIVIGIIILTENKKFLEPNVYKLLIFSYIATIISEISFIFYIDVFGLSNMIGHLFKIISFYFIYKAIIETNLLDPYRQLSSTTSKLKEEIRERIDNQERFKRIFDNSAEGKALFLPEGQFFAVNASFCKFTGYSEEELLSMRFHDITHPDDLHTNLENRQKLLDDKTKYFQMEKRYITKSGECVWGLLTTSVIRDMNGVPLHTIAAIQNITEHKKMQEEMYRLESFNLLGTMAAGISHEIRNPMTTVRGFLQLLGEKTDFINYKEYFTTMIEELDRANSIITEYLSLSKNKSAKPKLINLNSIIESLAPLIQADAMKKGKQVNLDLAHLPDQILYEIEIRQLILNLTSNGLEAMAKGGVLKLSTYVETDYVALAVQDEGNGIDSEIKEKLGTPFLTTKENGTGLGLSICYNIAIKHNAQIKVESSSEGTIFYVRFKKNKVITV